MSRLQDHPWRVKYSADDGDLIAEFYIPALACAVRYDRTTGYFSAGTLVRCFSGRGGEIRDGDGGRVISRDDIKQRFRASQAEILLCTDAAAEGLNFQFCGALLNYDMPWNPMRVEQRIGRIDRLGHPVAWRPTGPQACDRGEIELGCICRSRSLGSESARYGAPRRSRQAGAFQQIGVPR